MYDKFSPCSSRSRGISNAQLSASSRGHVQSTEFESDVPNYDTCRRPIHPGHHKSSPQHHRYPRVVERGWDYAGTVVQRLCTRGVPGTPETALFWSTARIDCQLVRSQEKLSKGSNRRQPRAACAATLGPTQLFLGTQGYTAAPLPSQTSTAFYITDKKKQELSRGIPRTARLERGLGP